MRRFDHHMANEVAERLRELRPDTQPAWGRLSAAGMVRHLADSLRYSMGRLGEVPSSGNFFSRYFIAPLAINGILPIPKNLRAADAFVAETTEPLEAERESLQAVIEEYLDAVQTGEMEPAAHPFFGPIGIDAWSKMHVQHFEHHLKQFGL